MIQSFGKYGNDRLNKHFVITNQTKIEEIAQLQTLTVVVAEIASSQVHQDDLKLDVEHDMLDWGGAQALENPHPGLHDYYHWVGVRASAKVEDKTDLTHCSGYYYYSSCPGVQHDEVVQEVLDEVVADYDLDNLEPLD